MDQLLAKSPRDGREITLAKHTRDVMEAAEALFCKGDGPGRLGESWLAFFNLAMSVWPAFRANLRAACAVHDWGKANDTFQAAVRGTGEQAIRHEHLSALLIGLPEVTSWLHAGELDVPLVLSAVLTHHLKASGKADGFASGRSGKTFRLVDYGDGFQEVLRLTADTLTLPALDIGKLPTRWAYGKPPTDVRVHRDRVQKTVLEPLKQAIRLDPVRGRLLSAVRAALIAADAAGSGLVREDEKVKVTDWIEQNVTRRELLTKATIWKDVIKKRVEEIKRAGKWHDKGDGKEGWNDFQLACDDLPDRALLLAPCGSGKTLAAWRWIAAQLDKRTAAHVLFLYPTRATAREGFKDYVSWAPEADAALMHGTSAFDLAGMFENPPDGDERKGHTYEVERRLYSLAYWPRRMFSATVDQFLAFMQYGYGPVCMLPVLADSVIVIDEVHSFDRNMFAALKDFLTNFKVPVLCMTATLTADRRDNLVKPVQEGGCGLTPPAAWPPDLVEVAGKPRYRLQRVADRTKAIQRVQEALAPQNKKRVLWVVNQVKRAHAVVRKFAAGFDPMSSATELRTADGVPVICYHSRFKLTDRVNRHADIMKALKDQPGPALGVTTQVCEMSLDLDVDLLVTEECPVTSLVQRMGRCNRDRNARPLDRSGEVLVYPPEDGDEAPYSVNDLKGRNEFLAAVVGKNLSQKDLEAALLAAPCPDPEGDPQSRFVTSGPYAVAPKEDDGDGFREGNDFNRSCLLIGDVNKFLQAEKAARILAKYGKKMSPSKVAGLKAVADQKPGFVVPVPRWLGRERDNENNPAHKALPGYLGVAADEHYHAAVGFCDFSLTEWRAD